MAKVNIKFTKDNEYYTPKSVIEYFGKFDYDPATSYEKAKFFVIKYYDTIETNGLTKGSNNRGEDTILEQRQEISDLEDNWDKLKKYFNERIEVCNNRLSAPFCNF